MKELNKEQLDWLSANYPNEEFKMINIPNKEFKYEYAISKNCIIINMYTKKELAHHITIGTKTKIRFKQINLILNNNARFTNKLLRTVALVFYPDKMLPNKIVIPKDGDGTNTSLSNVEITTISEIMKIKKNRVRNDTYIHKKAEHPRISQDAKNYINYLYDNVTTNIVKISQLLLDNRNELFSKNVITKHIINYKCVLLTISTNDVHQICKYIESGMRDVHISKIMNIQSKRINNIRHKKTHVNISKDYNF